MTMKNPIGWIDLPVSDLDRAENFYKTYFGYEFSRQPENNGCTMSWFPMDMESYGSGITLMHGPGYEPSTEGPLLYFPTPTEGIDETLERAKEQNITVLQEKMDIGEHGFYAVLQDSEGNRFGIHSMKE